MNATDAFNLALGLLIVVMVHRNLVRTIKIGHMTRMPIDLKTIAAGVAKDAREAALVGLREVLTEENSDKVIARLMEIIKPKLPFWARWLPLDKVLDALLPGALLRVFEEALG